MYKHGGSAGADPCAALRAVQALQAGGNGLCRRGPGEQAPQVRKLWEEGRTEAVRKGRPLLSTQGDGSGVLEI